MTTANGTSSRKPSGSSTHSGGHSPSGSPNAAAQGHGKLAPSSAFGGVGLKGLNGGWQMWGNGNAGSKRTASISSAASINDPSQQQTDGWNAKSNTWDISNSPGKQWDMDVGGSPNKKDSGQIARQRQAHPAQVVGLTPRIVGLNDDVQRFDQNTDAASNPRYPPPSPTKGAAYGNSNSPFAQAPSLPVPAHYESIQTNGAVEDLTLGLRGVTVEDDYRSKQTNGTQMPVPQTQGSGTIPQIRAPPPMQRAPFNGYAGQPDYSGYYQGASRDQYGDYQYSYESYRSTPDPNVYSPAPSSTGPVYPHPHDLHRSPSNVFYPEYSGARPPPGSPYYYPHQMMYHPPSPMPTPQLSASAATAASLSEKKRELQTMQYTLQQQQQQLSHQQNLILATMRNSPSPHPQVFPPGFDYSGQLPVIVPGTPVFPHALPHMPGYHQHQNARGRRDDAMQLRSPLLEEFRANKARKWELRDIFGYVVEFSGDQHGSRFIQQKLETATSEEKQIVFDEIVPDNALQLIQDVFGNYVIQKLFEHGTQVQKTALANTMDGHILLLSLQMYGCRVVQKAVEFVLPEQQASFVKELDGHVLKCVKDANGNHVIQKLIERVAPERLGFVRAFQGSVYELATHPYGCRVLQRCFEHLNEDQTRPLLEELHKYTINLMQDQFGNYVVQFVLEHGSVEDRTLIINKLRGQMLHMARHKFASNVCEKALQTADSENRRLLIEEIMTPKQDGVSPIVTMMKDQFANYVLQRALNVVEGEQKDVLISKIRPQLISMRRYSSAYSKHLISIEKLLLEKSPASASKGDSGKPEVKPLAQSTNTIESATPKALTPPAH